MTRRHESVDRRLWIVMPVHDNGKRFAEKLEDYRTALNARDRLVMVVDSGSNGTPEVARRAAANDRRLIVVVNEHRKGGAFSAGYRFVSAHAAIGDVVWYADADTTLAGDGVDGIAPHLDVSDSKSVPKAPCAEASLDGPSALNSGSRAFDLELIRSTRARVKSHDWPTERVWAPGRMTRTARAHLSGGSGSTGDSRKVLSDGQRVVLIALAVAMVVSLIVALDATLVALSAALTAFFAAANLMKLDLIRRGAAVYGNRVTDVGVPSRSADDDLPVYTILLPLYREEAVLGQLIDGILALDYPKGKLDVKLLLEQDDVTTRQAVAELTLPSCFEVVIVPDDGPAGKPRACNAGLARATGDYLVIYDAEDRPEHDQLRKAVHAFATAPPGLVCMQAKLNYFNRTHNLLTRWFTAEYSLWFDQLLPGLQAMDVAIPLGGTSNHFRTAGLRQLGGWDAFNVTEDADLGVRIYLNGWKTAILDSTTYEEATSRCGNWLRQRSRWVKGYMQTYLRHMTHPIGTCRQMGPAAFVVLQLFFGAATLCALINPLYWLITAAWFARHYHLIHVIFPRPLLYIGIIGLFVGNSAFVLATVSGAYARRNYEDVKWALLVPVYWILMSVAAWKALIQLFHRPFYWEKTAHGDCLYGTGMATAPAGGGLDD